MTNGSSIHQKEKTLTDNDGNSKHFYSVARKIINGVIVKQKPK